MSVSSDDFLCHQIAANPSQLNVFRVYAIILIGIDQNLELFEGVRFVIKFMNCYKSLWEVYQ